MTLNEKLNLISELESAKFNADTIESLVESLEHPENNTQFNNVEELWAYIDTLPEDGV